MTDYRIGYEYYKNACMDHGLQPLNFHYYILNLSHEQLEAYNQVAIQQNRGHYELVSAN
ncbi:MAG: transcriptional regulator [Lysinibacillus sp.]